MSAPLPSLPSVDPGAVGAGGRGDGERLDLTTADGVIIHAWRSFDPALCEDGHPGRSTPALIVCHGFVQNRRAFQTERRSLLAHLRSLGVVVYSLELRGRDGRHPANGLWDYVELDAPTLIRHVSDRHASVAWLGHSMGGLVATLLAPDVGERLDAVVTIGAPLLPGPPRLHTPRTTRAAIDAARLVHRAGRRFEGRRWSGALHAARHVLDQPLLPSPLRIWAPRSIDEESLAFALRESFADDSWAVFADLLELVVTDAARAGALEAGRRLAGHTRPLLVVAGTDDDLAPPVAARPVFERAASVDKEYLEVGGDHGVRAGHIDLLIGDAAPHFVWAPVTGFLRSRLGLPR